MIVISTILLRPQCNWKLPLHLRSAHLCALLTNEAMEQVSAKTQTRAHFKRKYIGCMQPQLRSGHFEPNSKGMWYAFASLKITQMCLAPTKTLNNLISSFILGPCKRSRLAENKTTADIHFGFETPCFTEMLIWIQLRRPNQNSATLFHIVELSLVQICVDSYES